MNPRYLSCALIVMTVLLTTQQLAQAQFESRFNFSGNYYVGMEHLMFNREEWTDASRNLIYSNNGAGAIATPVPQGVALSTDAMQFNIENGERIIFGAYLGARGQRLEASYFWLNNDWTSNATLPTGDYSLGTQLVNNGSAGMVSQVAALNNLDDITGVTAQRNSNVSGIEFNYIGAIVADNWHFNPIIGLRGFHLVEELRMTLSGAGTYVSDAENWMIGPQIGGELGYNVYRFGNTLLNFNVNGKFGVAANIASASYTLTGADSGANPDAPDDSAITLSPFGEIGVKAELTYGRFVGRVGYEAVMLGNVDLGGVPPDLFIFGSDTVTPNDTVFYHGFTAGGTISF